MDYASVGDARPRLTIPMQCEARDNRIRGIGFGLVGYVQFSALSDRDNR
jgi:hypothetical protein